eukprot:4125368-Pleurochrysis_carterae.AAC.1
MDVDGLRWVDASRQNGAAKAETLLRHCRHLCSTATARTRRGTGRRARELPTCRGKHVHTETLPFLSIELPCPYGRCRQEPHDTILSSTRVLDRFQR